MSSILFFLIVTFERTDLLRFLIYNSSAVAYRLPYELEEWVINAMQAAKAGNNPFPCKVAFGLIGNVYYVGLK